MSSNDLLLHLNFFMAQHDLNFKRVETSQVGSYFFLRLLRMFS